MIECPSCYRVFRQPPEKLGARCPKCKMPLYEDPGKRRKDPDKDYGRCDVHRHAGDRQMQPVRQADLPGVPDALARGAGLSALCRRVDCRGRTEPA